MPVFKFVISDDSNSYQVEKDSEMVIGKSIGDAFDADFLGLKGYELEITGGSDKDGFPMKKDVEGMGRRKIVLKKGHGFKFGESGVRRRRSVRGNTVSVDIVQINCKVSESGEKDIEELLGGQKEESESEKEEKSEGKDGEEEKTEKEEDKEKPEKEDKDSKKTNSEEKEEQTDEDKKEQEK